jgi:hypothetical protein
VTADELLGLKVPKVEHIDGDPDSAAVEEISDGVNATREGLARRHPAG